MTQKVRLAKLMLFIGMAICPGKPAIAQQANIPQANIPTGTYAAGDRYILIANNGKRTCYQGMSVPSLENSITVGETTGSLSNSQGILIAEGWSEYGRDIALNLEGSTIAVTHEGNRVGDYVFQGSELLGGNLTDSLTRCLSTSGIFFEISSPGYVITVPRIESAQALANASSAAPSLPLPSGLYYTRGTMNNNSRREILNRDGKICIKVIDGPASGYGGREEVVISSISLRNAQLYVDATDTEFIIYTEQALEDLFVSEGTTVAFHDGTSRSVWERNNATTAAQVGAALEQDDQMKACIESQGKYVREMEGAIIYGREF